MAPYAGCGKGGGSTGTLGVWASLRPSIPQRIGHLALWPCLSPGVPESGSKTVRTGRGGGGGVGEEREAVIESPKGTGAGRIGEFRLDFISLH